MNRLPLFAVSFFTAFILFSICSLFNPTASRAAAPAPGPAPAADPAAISVYGDSLADGLWSGFYEILKSSPQIRLTRHSQIGTGLVRPDFAAWQTEVAAEIQADAGGVAVVMFGANDMQGVRDENRKGYIFKSPGWVGVYTRRIDWLLQQFKDNHVTVVWVGLPVMRKPEMNEDAKYLSALYAAEAARYGAVFLPIYQDYLDADGGFMARIDDAHKRSQILRAEDGLHFSGYGYQLLAAKVLARIRQTAPVDVASAGKPGAVSVRP